MPLRPPPGRSGRIWLARRLEIARRASSLLDQKRSALLAEEHRLAAQAAAAGAEWEDAVRAAERWGRRATLLGGQRQLELIRAHTRAGAEVEVRWRSWMGVTYPAEAAVRPGQPGPSSLGGTAALDLGTAAYAAALEAGIRHAALARALDLIRAELAATTLRQRALERKWVPLLTDALGRLDTVLDELEREDAVRSRWLHARAARAHDRPPSSPGR
jgi:vacuolar-type H+-ATPase subunit D/Vma8